MQFTNKRKKKELFSEFQKYIFILDNQRNTFGTISEKQFTHQIMDWGINLKSL